MNPRSFSLLALSLTFSANLLSGCVFGDKGHRCETTMVEYSMGQAAPGGVTGDGLAKEVTGVHQVLLRPSKNAPADTRVTIPAIAENTPATLSIELLPNAVLTHEKSEYIPCRTGGRCTDNVVTCHDSFVLPIRATLKSAGGEIDETWEGELRRYDEAGSTKGSAAFRTDGEELPPSLELSRPANSFVGSFKISEPNLDATQRLRSHDIFLRVTIQKDKLIRAGLTSEIDAVGASRKDGSHYRFFQPLLEIVPAGS